MNINNQNIKSVLMSSGWKEIKTKLEEKIDKLKLPETISSKRSYQNIAIDVLARAKARRTIKNWLKELDIIKNESSSLPPKRFI